MITCGILASFRIVVSISEKSRGCDRQCMLFTGNIKTKWQACAPVGQPAFLESPFVLRNLDTESARTVSIAIAE